LAKLIAFNKPFQVLSQFTDPEGRQHLGDYIDQPGFYAAGRLDYDSEGLMLLTNDGQLQQQITSSGYHKTYLVQVEGRPKAAQLQQLRQGVRVQDYTARAVQVAVKAGKPGWLWKRNPPVRQRKNIPTSWLEVTLNQGKNRQVRRMCAAVGLPVLRLIRTQIGSHQLGQLAPGAWIFTDSKK
jgi:23S rRNA pseudouridine2457 synthase